MHNTSDELVKERALSHSALGRRRFRRTVVWAEPGFAPYGTLMIAGGKLVVLDETGDLVSAEAIPAQYRELAW